MPPRHASCQWERTLRVLLPNATRSLFSGFCEDFAVARYYLLQVGIG
jgi:hypothetical protein